MKFKFFIILSISILSIYSCKNNQELKKEIPNKEELSDKKEDQALLDERLIHTNEIWDSLSNLLRNKDLKEIYRDSLQNLFFRNKNDQEIIFKTFIKENPNSIVSLESLNGFKFAWGKDTTQVLFETLNPELKKLENGKLVENYIAYYKNPKINDTYSDFELYDSQGKNVVLSNALTEFTLLEFWASWCSGCRKEHPDLIEVYEKYRSKNFSIIGISSDNNEKDWKSAIETDSLPWLNLRDPNGKESIVQYQYGIHALPSNFLIGPKGTIIAKDLNPKELDIFLRDQIFQNAKNIGVINNEHSNEK